MALRQNIAYYKEIEKNTEERVRLQDWASQGVTMQGFWKGILTIASTMILTWVIAACDSPKNKLNNAGGAPKGPNQGANVNNPTPDNPSNTDPSGSTGNNPQTPAVKAGTGWSLSSSPLYSMTADQLSKVPMTTIQKELDTLRQQKQNWDKELVSTKAFNSAMCRRLEKLESECAAQIALIPKARTELGCDISKNASHNPTLTVSIANSDADDRFRLLANHDFVSNEFGEGKTEVTFTSLGNQMIQSAKIRDITSLELVRVSSGSAIVNGYIQSRSDFKNIGSSVSKINVSLSLDETLVPSTGSLKLSLPAEVKSSLTIGTEELMALSQTPACRVTFQDIEDLRVGGAK